MRTSVAPETLTRTLWSVYVPPTSTERTLAPPTKTSMCGLTPAAGVPLARTTRSCSPAGTVKVCAMAPLPQRFQAFPPEAVPSLSTPPVVLVAKASPSLATGVGDGVGDGVGEG